MKKKSASQSAFFNPRILLASVFCLAGMFIALLGFGTFSAQAQQNHKIITQSLDPLVPPGFDCSKIHELGIDRQENFRAGAIMIFCGQAEGGSASPEQRFSQLIQQLLPAPLAYGGTDVDLVTGAETSPHVTQSETYTTANPDNPNQIFVTYNDSRTAPGCYGGGSLSTDGGTTFTRLTPSPFCTGHGTNFGDPVTLYNKPTSTFFGIFLATGCGGQGIGSWKSTDGGLTWSVGACVHTGSMDDRESGWADNNPTSPHYGRMYVSWNDFAVGGGALFVTVSTDNGATWTPHQITTGSPFIRDVQITGDLVTGDVYIAGMNEGGGGTAGPRSNLMFRSTDGGTTWTNTYTGPTFTGPSDGSTCSSNSYFATMFSGYWRHMGWGEPGAINHVVHYVYAQHGTGSDPGDVYYIRSTDSGVTFSAPFKLNTDATTLRQWQPNLSVSPSGTVFAVWYDGREGTGCTPGVNTPCYRMWARKSTDNGVTWLSDMPFSDVVSPLPAQPDPNVVSCYAGDYDYGSAIATKHLSSWVDGRVAISGTQQQDAFTDRELLGPTPTSTPTPTATATFTPTPTATATSTPTATATSTPTPTATATPTATPTSTPTPTPAIQVTVQTNPTGLSFTVDGTTYTSAQTFSWVPGSSHTIATTSPQSGGTGVRYVWNSWTGGGAISHTVAPTTNKTYTASFRTQYRLTMSHGSGGTVSPTSGWRNSGAAISISAIPANGYSFTNWSGSGTGSYSGTNNPASITMGGPITETATFTHN